MGAHLTFGRRATRVGLAVVLLIASACQAATPQASGAPSGSATAATSATPGTPIKIGGIFSLTGSQGVNGVVFREGADAALKYVNANGGINGRPLELVANDDQSRPEQAIAFAQQLGADSSIVASIGFTGLTGPAGIEEMNKQKMPTIQMAGFSKNTDDPGHYGFYIAPTFDMYSYAIMRFVHDTMKLTKIGLIWESTAYGQSFDDNIRAKAADYGVQLVDSENVPQNNPDDTLAIQRIISAGAQVIVLGTAATNAVPVNNWAALGSPIPVIGGIGLSSPAQIKGAEENGKKITAIVALFTGDEPLPRQKDFVGNFKAINGKVPQYQNALGWDAITMLAKVLRTGADTREKVRDTLETSFNKYEGAGGVYTFTATQHLGYDPTGLVFVRYTGDGHYTLYK